MQKLVEWFIYSSKDKEKLALTVRGIIGFAMTILFALGVTFTGLNLDTFVGDVVDFIVNLATIITSVMTAYGIMRKIVLTTKEFYNK